MIFQDLIEKQTFAKKPTNKKSDKPEVSFETRKKLIKEAIGKKLYWWI